MKKILYSFIVLAVFVINSSCKKKFDLPPVKDAPTVNGYIKIDSIRKCYVNYYLLSTPPLSKWYRFSGDVNLECTVTADETSGNIYKTVYVEDATGALQVKLVNAGGLFVGDKIRINLNGAILNDYGNMVQLDSIDIEKRVVKLSSGNPVTPTKVTFNQLLAFDLNDHTPFQSRLVVIDSVEFELGSKSEPFADAIGKYSIDHMLVNSTNSMVAVRSSGYSNFANNLVPCGKGSMTVIVGQYNSDLQFTIRDHKEVKLANNGCPILKADFNGSSVLKGGWINYRVGGGAVDWKLGTYNGKKYGEISNYIGGNNVACETWFISPPINLLAAPNPYFAFESAYSFSGPTLEVKVCTDYISGNPTTATWVSFNPSLSGGSFNWVQSGNLSLNAFKSTNTRIAFVYKGTAVDGSRWEVDNIGVFAELP